MWVKQVKYFLPSQDHFSWRIHCKFFPDTWMERGRVLELMFFSPEQNTDHQTDAFVETKQRNLKKKIISSIKIEILWAQLIERKIVTQQPPVQSLPLPSHSYLLVKLQLPYLGKRKPNWQSSSTHLDRHSESESTQELQAGSHQVWNMSPITWSKHRKQFQGKDDEKKVDGWWHRTAVSYFADASKNVKC